MQYPQWSCFASSLTCTEKSLLCFSVLVQALFLPWPSSQSRWQYSSFCLKTQPWGRSNPYIQPVYTRGEKVTRVVYGSVFSTFSSCLVVLCLTTVPSSRTSCMTKDNQRIFSLALSCPFALINSPVAGVETTPSEEDGKFPSCVGVFHRAYANLQQQWQLVSLKHLWRA